MPLGELRRDDAGMGTLIPSFCSSGIVMDLGELQQESSGIETGKGPADNSDQLVGLTLS
jgi:hypothetical protein